MLKECADCGVSGKLGNSILTYMRRGLPVYLCWDCTATPYQRRQMRLNGRKPGNKAQRQQNKQKP